jgi:hypothetical protein
VKGRRKRKGLLRVIEEREGDESVGNKREKKKIGERNREAYVKMRGTKEKEEKKRKRREIGRE